MTPNRKRQVIVTMVVLSSSHPLMNQDLTDVTIGDDNAGPGPRRHHHCDDDADVRIKKMKKPLMNGNSNQPRRGVQLSTLKMGL